MKASKRKRETVAAKAPANESSPIDATPVVALRVVEQAVEENVMAEQPSDRASAEPRTHLYALSANCTVRDCVELKSALLDLLADPLPVTIDVRAVERIDTAALQVLCAFVRDRKASGGVVEWVGTAESFCEAVRLLGLRDVLGAPDAVPHGVAA